MNKLFQSGEEEEEEEELHLQQRDDEAVQIKTDDGLDSR